MPVSVRPEKRLMTLAPRRFSANTIPSTSSGASPFGWPVGLGIWKECEHAFDGRLGKRSCPVSSWRAAGRLKANERMVNAMNRVWTICRRLAASGSAQAQFSPPCPPPCPCCPPLVARSFCSSSKLERNSVVPRSAMGIIAVRQSSVLQ